MIGFALVLLLGAAAGLIAAEGTRAPTRGYLRLAAVLYCAMAISESFGITPPQVRAIVMTLGAPVLTLAAYSTFRKPPRLLSATVVLAAAAVAGVASAMLGQTVLAATPQLLSALTLLVIARPGTFAGDGPGIYLSLSAVCLLGAAACSLAPVANIMAHAGLLLFAAAGIAGTALASNLLVVERGNDRATAAIGRRR